MARIEITTNGRHFTNACPNNPWRRSVFIWIWIGQNNGHERPKFGIRDQMIRIQEQNLAQMCRRGGAVISNLQKDVCQEEAKPDRMGKLFNCSFKNLLRSTPIAFLESNSCLQSGQYSRSVRSHRSSAKEVVHFILLFLPQKDLNESQPRWPKMGKFVKDSTPMVFRLVNIPLDGMNERQVVACVILEFRVETRDRSCVSQPHDRFE